MEHDFWHNAWETGKTGWRQRRANTRLVKYWPDIVNLASADRSADGSQSGSLAHSLKSKPVFVPLCGDSPDLLWLRDQGHQVIGCELNRSAISAFYANNQLAHVVTEEDNFQVFDGSGIRIYVGDLFDLKPDHLAGVSLIYDRAAAVALEMNMRELYASHLASLLPSGGDILMLAFVYDQAKMEGPPFSVTDEEVRTHYGRQFSINLLGSSSGSGILGNLADRGLDTIDENVYHLRRDD